MSRNLDSSLLTQLQSAEVAPLFAVQMDFDTAPLRLWSGTGALTIEGDEYAGAGPLLQISAVPETTQMQALGVSLRLSGLDTSILGLALAEPYQGRTVSLWMAAMDTATRTLIGTRYLIFRGRMDVMEINETGETCDITLACEHMLIDLDKPRLRYYSSADQAIDFPGDKGLDMIPALQDAAFKWG